jgi:glycosyltransferase involved in cell wall biosynthesis
MSKFLGSSLKLTKNKIGLDLSALDTNFKSHAGRGIGRYVYELNRCFSNIENKNVVIDNFDYTDFKLPDFLERTIKSLPFGRQTVRQQLVYPFQLNKGKVGRFDLLHFPAHMDAPSWSPKPYLVTVLDLIPLVCRDLYQAEIATWRFKLARQLELSGIKKAHKIIAISESTAKDLTKILNIPAEKIRVTPLGVATDFFREVTEAERLNVLKRYSIEYNRQILLYLGGIDARKNVPALIELIEELVLHTSNPPTLVLAGKMEDDRNYPSLLDRIDNSKAKEYIYLLGYIPDHDVRGLLSATTAFVFPSFYEGFGLPPLEAMASGVPVVCAKTSSLTEVVGDDGFWFNPNNIKTAIPDLIKLLNSPELRNEYKIRGKNRATQFSWENTATKTLNIYEEALSTI